MKNLNAFEIYFHWKTTYIEKLLALKNIYIGKLFALKNYFHWKIAFIKKIISMEKLPQKEKEKEKKNIPTPFSQPPHTTKKTNPWKI